MINNLENPNLYSYFGKVEFVGIYTIYFYFGSQTEIVGTRQNGLIEAVPQSIFVAKIEHKILLFIIQ